MVTFERKCPICKKVNRVQVDPAAYRAYQKGAFVQEAFPNLSPDERKIVISGTCGACWDAMFKEDVGEEFNQEDLDSNVD